MSETAECKRCGYGHMTPLTATGGGQVGWFCEECNAMYAEGEYIDIMRQRCNARGEYRD